MISKRYMFRVLLVSTLCGVFLAAFTTQASAQEKAQKNCINSINKGSQKVAKTQGKANSSCVKDYGNGIPEDIKSLLLKESITTKPDGYGFGLMSCREIIEDRHNGKIYFDSEEGKGAEFHFTLGHTN